MSIKRAARVVATRAFPLMPFEMQRLVLIGNRHGRYILQKRTLQKTRIEKNAWLRMRLVTGSEIARDLAALGVKRGDVLFVHSSMSSIGRVPGGPDEVIDAILNVLSTTGTLAMLAYSQPYGSQVDSLYYGRNEIFDPNNTPSTFGLIPETFRKRTGVHRSTHPTNSVCAFGELAHSLTSGARQCSSTYGVGTPLYKVMEYGGKILGLGTDLGPVTFYHVIEDVLPDRFPVDVWADRTYSARVMEDGKLYSMKIRPRNSKVAIIWNKHNAWLRMLFTDFLIDRGVLKIGKVGHARSWLMSAKELFEAQLDLLNRGITIYTTKSEYDSKYDAEHRLVHYVTNYRSAFSDARHSYLEEQVRCVARNHQQKGFWDVRSKNWIKELEWNGSDWSGYLPHDWQYAIEMQEGATQYALLTGSHALDNHLQNELEYIDSKINNDGSISGIPDSHWVPEEYEYGAVLSALALGYQHFMNENKTLGEQILRDLDLVHGFMTRFKPTYNDAYTVVLRGYANLLSAYLLSNAVDRVRTVLTQIDEYAQVFIRHQNRDGLFPLLSTTGGESGLYWQLKVDVALLLSYAFTNVGTYLDSAARNIDWVTRNLLEPNGALKWHLSTEEGFFEIHQTLYMIACRYLCDLSKSHRDRYADCIRAWKFLVDTNPGYIDMYVENARLSEAFFSFRNMDSQGRFQKGDHGKYKGAYEIGYSLWALALNRDLSI